MPLFQERYTNPSTRRINYMQDKCILQNKITKFSLTEIQRNSLSLSLSLCDQLDPDTHLKIKFKFRPRSIGNLGSQYCFDPLVALMRACYLAFILSIRQLKISWEMTIQFSRTAEIRSDIDVGRCVSSFQTLWKYFIGFKSELSVGQYISKVLPCNHFTVISAVWVGFSVMLKDAIVNSELAFYGRQEESY